MVNPHFWAGQQTLTSGYFDMRYPDANLRSRMQNQRNPSNNNNPQPSAEHLAASAAFSDTQSEREQWWDVRSVRWDGWSFVQSPQLDVCERKRRHLPIAALRPVIKHPPPQRDRNFGRGTAWPRERVSEHAVVPAGCWFLKGLQFLILNLPLHFRSGILLKLRWINKAKWSWKTSIPDRASCRYRYPSCFFG